MKVSINSKIENNVCVTNRKAIKKAFEEFNGKEVTITIQRKKKKRSEQQNRYYWGCLIKLIVTALKESTGERYSDIEVHEMLKFELHYKELVNEQTGQVIKIGKSTTTDSTIEFEEYQDDCRKWAKEWLNIDIPMPNEEIEIDFN